MLWWADVHSSYGVNALYAFPTYRQMQDFIKMRLNPVLESVPYYRGIIDPNINSIDVKKIRNSFMTFRTSSKSSALEGVNADIIFLDEYDHVLPAALQSAKNSLSSSSFKMMRRFSTPTSPDFGIHDLFMHSDQMEYLHKCTHCGYWNLLSYDDYNGTTSGGNIKMINPNGVNKLALTVQPGTFEFVCKKCGQPLDRWYNGAWVQRFPDRTKGLNGIRGYHISQMNAVWVSADKLKTEEMNSKSKQAFYNYNLGMPYEDVKLKVNEKDIVDNGHFPERKMSREDYALISVGIDWGRKNSIVILGLRPNGNIDLLNVFQIDSAAPTESTMAGHDIEALRVRLAPYEPDIIMADVGDSGERISRLMGIYGRDKVFGARYSSNPTAGLYKSSGKFEPSWNLNSNEVTLDKLVINKRFIDMMKHGEIGFWKKHDTELLMYIEHWTNVIIRDEEQQDGSMRQVIGRKSGDHYAQASTIALIGLDKLRQDVYGEDSYDFDYTRLDADFKPEDTDFRKRINDSSQGSLFD